MARLLPESAVMDVDDWVDDQLRNPERNPPRDVLDDDGIATLHDLAASLYASGWDQGERSERTRARARHTRTRNRAERQAAVRAAIDAVENVTVPRQLLLDYFEAVPHTLPGMTKIDPASLQRIIAARTALGEWCAEHGVFPQPG